MYLPKFLEQKFSEFLKIQSKHFGKDAIEKSGSTDCNISHLMAIPAVALANYNGGETHTREEWVEKTALKQA